MAVDGIYIYIYGQLIVSILVIWKGPPYLAKLVFSKWMWMKAFVNQFTGGGTLPVDLPRKYDRQGKVHFTSSSSCRI